MIFDPTQEGACILHDDQTGQTIFGANPLKVVQNVQFVPKNPLVGYLAYPNPTLKNEIPDQLFYEYPSLHVIPSNVEGSRSLDSFHSLGMTNGYSTSGKLEQSVTKAQYIKKIHQIKELLVAGEVYQINYAIRFRKKFKGNAYTLFQKLIAHNPAPYAAYLNCGDFQILSLSPEQLFRVNGRTITTQPIKGTVSKSDGPQALKNLLASPKERAELDMITDLERNDLGRICEFGTVRVTKERAIMELPNLWHTYSEIRGKLRTDVRTPDVFKALFPGGSITGCPKLRAMEYIEKLEGLPRNIFTGSIGYVSGDTMNFNIAIRTALVHHGYIEYWAGGGIVYDSDPEKEYAECMLKAEKFLVLL
ncbi:MAG: anthranilate synthase component I family protein [Candidatus Peregrinibacteria bacterium]